MKYRPSVSIFVAAIVVGGSAMMSTTGQCQEAQKEGIKKENPLPPSGSAGGNNHSDQNAKQESSSKVEGTSPTPQAFVNGALTGPGAPADVDTVPSKFSARTAADDQLPIAGYRFKNLTTDQLKNIRAAIRQASPQGSGSRAIGGFAQVGSELPTAVALNELHPLPVPLLSQMPALNGVVYTLSEDKVLLVNATTRVVMGVLE